MLDFLRENREKICGKFVDAIEGRPLSYIPSIKVPKISIITSMFKAGKYIEHFMKEVTNQTIFSNCEFIIMDADSPDGEYKIIKEYMEKYDNIVYERLDSTPSVQETMNMAIKKRP